MDIKNTVPQLLADSRLAFLNQQNDIALNLANKAIKLEYNNADAYKCAGNALFHQLLQGQNQLVDDLVLPLANIVCDAGTDMACEQITIKGVKRCTDRCRLCQNIRTVSAALNHARMPRI